MPLAKVRLWCVLARHFLPRISKHSTMISKQNLSIILVILKYIRSLLLASRTRICAIFLR